MSIDHGKLLATIAAEAQYAGYFIGDERVVLLAAVQQIIARELALAQTAEAVEGERRFLQAMEDANAREIGETDAAQGAVAPFAYGADLTPGDYDMEHSVWLLRPGESVPAGCTPLYTHPQAAPAQGDGWKLVPVNATEEMRSAFAIAMGDTRILGAKEQFRIAYAKLLAAAPSQEGE